MADTEFTLDTPNPNPSYPVAPADGSFTLDTAPAPAHDIRTKLTVSPNPEKPYEGFVSTALTGAATNLLGIPGELANSSSKYIAEHPDDLVSPITGEYTGPQFPSQEVFHHLIGRHLPTGDEIKDWFYSPEGPGGKAGMVRREPNPESLPEQMVAGGITQGATAAIPGVGVSGAIPKVLATLGGAIGPIGEKLFPNHPALGNFAAQLLTMLGIGGATKAVKEAAPVLRETLGGSAENRAGTALVRESGLPKDELENRLASPTELVPGSKPTTSQVVNTPGMAAAEKSVRGSSPLQWQERDTEQQNARSSAAAAVSPSGNTSAPRDFLQDVKEKGEAKVQNLEQNAADELKARLSALGPDATPDQAGKVIREVAERHYNEAQAGVDKSYSRVIQPNRAEKVMIDPTSALRRVDRRFSLEYPKTNPPPKELLAFRDALENNGDKLTYREMMGLVKRAGTEAYKMSGDNKRMMLDMRDIVLQRMEASASDVGKLPPALHKFSSSTEGAAFSEARTNADRLTRLNELRDIEGLAPRTWKGSRKDLDKLITDTELRMRDDAGVKGNMNPEEYDRMITAREGKEAMRDRYSLGAMGDVLAGGTQVGGTRLTDSGVPGRFWHAKGTTSKENLDQFSKEFGSDKEATAALREYAVGNLRALVDSKGGELTPSTLNKYMADHRTALDSPIGKPIKDELSNLQTARTAINNDIERSTNFLRDYSQSAARFFLDKGGQARDPALSIAEALRPTNKTGAADMAQLAKQAKLGGPEVEAGLKTLVHDDFVKSTGGFADAAKAKEWLDNNADKVRPILGQKHIDNLQTIADDMSRGTHPATGNVKSAARMLNDSLQGGYALLDVKFPGVSVLTGFAKRFLTGSSHDTELVHDLFNEAMLNPELAKALVTNVNRNTERGVTAILENAWTAIKKRTSHDSGAGRAIAGPLKVGGISAAEQPNGQ